MQLAPNTVIAQRFRLNRQLGRGGMGSVWHATHLGLDIPCAVKFIEGEYAQLPEAQARFEREAKAAAQLRSPHVVQILDHGVCDGVPYIAMELLDGEDLGKRIARVGRMNPQELVTVVTQVCRALTKAHSVGVVHRDLKPDNIFLVKDDDREIAKVLDFGIAKANSNALEGSNTKTGAMLGTPYYMSPEQAQGTKSVDSRSDLWSLAVIVFQAITGRLPFESEALGDLLVKIIVSPVPVPSQLAPDVPGGMLGCGVIWCGCPA
jgi:serine/threonine protein kinase